MGGYGVDVVPAYIGWGGGGTTFPLDSTVSCHCVILRSKILYHTRRMVRVPPYNAARLMIDLAKALVA